jgi:hypothetical protein
MGTYDHKKILADYARGKMSVEQAMGHTLQHIDKLYELQTTANINRYKLRGRLDKLDKTVSTLQAEIALLTSLIKDTTE